MASNRSIVEKADFAVASLIGGTKGGYLNPIQGATFIRMMIEQPTILKDIRVLPMDAPRQEFNKIGFGSRILKAPPAGTVPLPVADRSAPTTEKIELLTKKVKAEIILPYDVLEDNIERGALEDTIMELAAERASLDLEELIILGDTDSADSYLALVDGILVQATSHVVDYSASPVTLINNAPFKAGVMAMPNKYMRNRKQMKWYVSPNAETEYIDWRGNRVTTTGDTVGQSDVVGNNSPFGIPMAGAALMPDANYILTYPKNIILGVQRQMMVESDRDIRAEALIFVMTMRLDILFETEDAVVKFDGLAPGTTTTTA